LCVTGYPFGHTIGLMGASWPFVGRQEELVLLAQAMRDPTAGGLVLAGPAGVGKTRLALEALSRADPAMFVIRRAVATQATRPIPFGALASLLPAELPPASNRVNLLRLAAEALLSAAGHRRLVVAIDEAQLLDELSAALVHQLVRGKAAFVLVMVRAGELAPDPITALWRNRLVERVDLAELLRPDVEQVLVEHLGGPVDGMTVERLWQASRGNALLLRELVGAGHQVGALQRVEGVWRWQGPWVLAPRLVELMQQRLGQLSPSERDVLELLAYADPIGPDLLARLTSVEAVEAVEGMGLCWAEESGRRVLVHLAHPLYGEVLRTTTPVLRARRRQRQLAEVLEETGARRADDWLQVATWRLSSGSTASPPVLLAAARRAWALLDLPLAERLARAAFDAGDELEASEVLWRVLGVQGRNDEAEQLLAGLEDAPVSDQERGRLAIARAYVYWGQGQIDAGLTLLDDTVARTTAQQVRDELHALQVVMLTYVDQYQRAAELADELLDRRDLRGPLRAPAHHAKGLTQLFEGQTAQAVDSFDRALAVPGWAAEAPWLGETARACRCQAQLLEGQIAAAAASAEAAYQAALDSGWDMAIALACVDLGEVCRARGKLQQSMRWLREGLGVLRGDRSIGFLWTPVVLGELAHTAALLGDHAAASRALAEADATLLRGSGMHRLWVALARPWVTAAGGDRTAAIQEALQIANTLREAGAPVYEATVLHDVCRLGGAAKAASRLGELAQASSNPLIRCYAAHAAALVEHDGVGLEQVSTDLEGIGALLLGAEAVAEASRAHRRGGRADSARRAAARAAALAARCEGAATPALQAIQAPDLTPREWEIVKLAASGLTNEDIAHRLVVSVRTVHNHLHQAYAKLGVHRRTDLTAVLDVRAQGRSGPEYQAQEFTRPEHPDAHQEAPEG
jgi:DNA-binding CsgD family transcriptional regulator